MDTARPEHCRRNTTLWGIFLLVLGTTWGLSAWGIIDVDVWRFAGPFALVTLGVAMTWNRATA